MGQNNPNRVENTDILLMAVDIPWKDDKCIACQGLNDIDSSSPEYKKQNKKIISLLVQRKC